MGGMIVSAGEVFGNLEVIREVEATYWRKYRKRQILCKCICNKETIVSLSNLRNGHTKSCGCAVKISASITKTTHGKTKTRLYSIWAGVKNRCLNKNVKSYKDYGARGICVCVEWLEFVPFYEWAIKANYKDNLTIERIDNSGNYEPSNCTWIPKEEQSKNRRNTLQITYKNETKTLSEWSKKTGLNYDLLQQRIACGWDINKAFEQPVRVKYGY